MGMPAAELRWTADMVRALPDDGNRYEVIDGGLYVTPAPSWTHQRAVMRLMLRLQPYLETHALGECIVAPADIEFDVTRMVEPDLFVIPSTGARLPRSWDEVRRLLLVVEIVSPSSARADRLAKRQLYQQEGVPEYWIVDPDARLVERWTPAEARPEVLTDHLIWRPAAAPSSLDVDLGAFFTEVLGESAS